MAISKPSIPKGTRDFGPFEMVKRNYIFETIKKVFKNYSYLPIETPAMENISTLLGKYGDEGDKLLFKILNSGDYLSNVDNKKLSEKDSQSLSLDICDRGLRYDLTVPFARFVVQHRNELTFPFRRYQIQPVWRADRPQKGRYREFYQCDADVIGSDSLINEAELLSILDEVFSRLGIGIVIKLNNRKILAGMAEIMDAGENLTDLTIAMDKMDKIGMDKVIEEMQSKGFSNEKIDMIRPVLEFSGSTMDKMNFLSQYLKESAIGIQGLDELQTVLNYCNQLNIESEIELDLSLARGLNYYTGAIIEVKALDVEMGSICGGGRYDDLTGIFGLPDVSGVGISFGADRIYDVMEQLKAFPDDKSETTSVLFVNFGKKEALYILPILNKVRKAGIKAEIYPDPVKMKKQMNYADKRNVPFVAIIGEDEMNSRLISVKNMETGEQSKLTVDQLIELVG